MSAKKINDNKSFNISSEEGAFLFNNMQIDAWVTSVV